MKQKVKAKKRSFPLFALLYFTLLFVGIAAAYVAMHALTAYLEEYEAAQPATKAEYIFQTRFQEPDYLSLIAEADADAKLALCENAEDLADYFSALTEGQTLTYSSVSAGLEESYQYAVRAGDKRIATFSLRDSGRRTKHDLVEYTLDKLELFSTAENKVQVKIFSGSRLMLNGVTIPESYKVGEPENTASAAYLPEGVPPVQYVSYTVDGLLTLPVVQVVNSAGENAELKQDSNGVWVEELHFDAALQEKYEKQMLDAVRTYCCYIQDDAKFTTLAKYLETNSTVYKNTSTIYNNFVMDHSSYAFEGERADEFYAYDENTFSCRVRLTHVLHQWKKDYRDPIDLTFYVRRQPNGEFRIYDLQNNA